MLPYPQQLHGYMGSYKPGSWWVYANRSGLRDSVYVTDLKETRRAVDQGEPLCLGMPTTEFVLRSNGMAVGGTVPVRYAVYDPGSVAVNITAGDLRLDFGFNPREGTGGAAVRDTTIGMMSIVDALLVTRRLGQPRQQLESVLLAKNIGIVSYSTVTDTFTLVNYHIP